MVHRWDEGQGRGFSYEKIEIFCFPLFWRQWKRITLLIFANQKPGWKGGTNNFIENEQQFDLMFYHFQIFFSLYYFNNLVCAYFLFTRDKVFFWETCGNNPAGPNPSQTKILDIRSVSFLLHYFSRAAESSSFLASFWAHFIGMKSDKTRRE